MCLRPGDMDRKDLTSYMTMAISYTSLFASTLFVRGSPGEGDRDGLEGLPLKWRREGKRDGEEDLLLDRAGLPHGYDIWGTGVGGREVDLLLE